MVSCCPVSPSCGDHGRARPFPSGASRTTHWTQREPGGRGWGTPGNICRDRWTRLSTPGVLLPPQVPDPPIGGQVWEPNAKRETAGRPEPREPGLVGEDSPWGWGRRTPQTVLPPQEQRQFLSKQERPR